MSKTPPRPRRRARASSAPAPQPSGLGRLHGLPPGGVEALSDLQRQAMVQLQTWAPVLQRHEGWAWVDMALAYDLSACRAYRKAPVQPKAVSPVETEALAALQLQLAYSEQALDEAYAAQPPCDDERIQTLEHRCLRHAVLVEEMQTQQEACVPQAAPWVGALIAFDRCGWVLVQRHLVRVEDWPRVQAALAGAKPEAREPTAVWCGTSTAVDDDAAEMNATPGSERERRAGL